MTEFWQWIYDWPLSTSLRSSLWAFPIIECIHIYSMVSLIALFALFDIRLGFEVGGPRRRSVPELAKIILRWIWVPISVNALTGVLMFIANSTGYAANLGFRIKLCLILFGLVYHMPLLYKASGSNRGDEFSLTAGKAVGVFSVLIWLGVIFASRWIAYT